MKHFLLLLIACSLLSLQAMDDWGGDYDYQGIGRTQDFLKKVNNIYNPIPSETEGPFNKERVLNTPYLQEIVKASPEKKDEASQTMCNFQFYNGAKEWALQRTYLAAAALCGGKKGLDKGLETATRAQDYHLCQLLLEHDAKPGYLLKYVRTVKLAELFIAHNASLEMKDRIYKLGLLHDVAFSHDYESGLIPLYRKHGLSPLAQDNPLFSLLHSIDILPWPHSNEEEVLQKARFLVADLSPEDTINLLFHYPDPFRGHILTTLKHATAPQASTTNKFIEDRLKIELYKILLQAKADAEQKLGKPGLDGDYYYTKHTDLYRRPPFKEKKVVVRKRETKP